MITYHNDNQETILHGGDLLLIDLSSIHKFHTLEETKFTFVLINGLSIPYYYERIAKNTNCKFIFPITLDLISCFYQIAGLPFYADCIHIHKLLTNLLADLILQHDTGNALAPGYLIQLKEELEQNYAYTYTLELLEKEYQVNRYRLCKEFRKHFNTTPIQYLHEIRIQASQSLLIETDMKIHEIAFEIGYDNTNYFISHFKKFVGTTPAEYRKYKNACC